MVIKLSVIEFSEMKNQATKKIEGWSPTVTIDGTTIRQAYDTTPVREDKRLSWLSPGFTLTDPVPTVATLMWSVHAKNHDWVIYLQQYIDLRALHGFPGVLYIDAITEVHFSPHEARELASLPQLHGLAGMLWLARGRVRVEVRDALHAGHQQIMKKTRLRINRYRRCADPLRQQLEKDSTPNLTEVAPVFGALSGLFFEWSKPR